MGAAHLALGCAATHYRSELNLASAAFDEGGTWRNYLRLDPVVARLRDQPRFAALLARIVAADDGATMPS